MALPPTVICPNGPTWSAPLPPVTVRALPTLRLPVPVRFRGTPEVRPAEKVAFARQWQRKLYDGGWAGLAWPKEYGGQALSTLEQMLFHEEYFAAGSDAVETNTFGANLANLGEYGIESRIRELSEAGARLAPPRVDCP